MNTLALTYTQQNLIDWLFNQIFVFRHHPDSQNIHIDENEKVWIRTTQEQLASTLGCVRMTVIRTVKFLKEYGIIITKKTFNETGYHTLCYTLSDEFLASKKFQELNSICNVPNATQQCYNHLINSNKSNKSKDNFSKEFQRKKEEEEGQPKTTIAQDMLSMWNRYFPRQMMSMSKDLARYLVAAFQRKFKSLRAWDKYLTAIKHSAYLMGEKFKLFLNWILKFRTIDRIMNGELGCPQYDYTDLETAEEKQHRILMEVVDHIEAIDESEKCKTARRGILQKLRTLYHPDEIGSIYQDWFKKVRLEEKAGDIWLTADSAFRRDYILMRFNSILSGLDIRVMHNLFNSIGYEDERKNN